MRKIITILLICFISKAWSNKISSAYEALSIYNYFEAKKLFYKSLSKYPSASSYGLATIYFRNDNPFSNIDSAAKYIAICKLKYKDSISYSSFHINPSSIEVLAQKISLKAFTFYCSTNQSKSLNHF